MTSPRPEDVIINLLRAVYRNARHSALRLPARRPAYLCAPGSPARYLSTAFRSRPCLRPPGGRGPLHASAKLVCACRKQPYATTGPANPPPREIAVIGAGITGLTAAHYLARYATNARITIYEASHKPGGWIEADRVKVKDGEGRQGHVLLQSGPRMLRSSSKSKKYDDLVLYDVLASLGIGHEIRRPQAVSENRYLYYPDHLVKMPAPNLNIDNLVEFAQSYLTEPIWSGSLRALLAYLIDAPGPEYFKEDESVAEFLTKLLKDERLVNNIVSAMMHGIYGGDINKLSAKHTMLDDLWYSKKAPSRVEDGNRWIGLKEWYLLYDMMSSPNRLKIIELAENAVNWKLLAFEDGLISLVRGLVKDLKMKNNVTFKYGEPVTSLKHKDGKILVTTPKANPPAKFDHVICTLFSKQLSQIAKPQNSLPSLAETHAVTIMVVNLWYPNPNLLGEGGFGYLIPSSVQDNHEGALGVLFDSDLRTNDSEMPGTKLTVMLGGHHWDGWVHLPSEEQGITMAKEVVRRHLGISDAEEVVARAKLCRECLPQHFVGHRERMKEAHYELMSTFHGHLTVAGPSYTTIGVIPSMRAGYDAAMRVALGRPQPWFPVAEQTTDHTTKSDQPLELDYWRHKPHVTPGGGEVADFIGASGLEQFTESEWAGLQRSPREHMFFRTFTDDALRFRDADGRPDDVNRRIFINAPRGYAIHLIKQRLKNRER
ncbi:Protoporphyrinogen oxidase [Xylaria palmicola]|nr:Protoporphyrinogen oxidase [Xylaria palmicola]